MKNGRQAVDDFYTRHLKVLLNETLPKAKKQDYRLVSLPLHIVADYLHTKLRHNVPVPQDFPKEDVYAYLVGTGRSVIKDCKYYIFRKPSPDPRAKGPRSYIKKMCNAQIINTYDGCADCDIKLKCLLGEPPPLEIE